MRPSRTTLVILYITTLVLVLAQPLSAVEIAPAPLTSDKDTSFYLPIIITSSEPIIPSTTKVLTPATVQQLESISPDGSTFIFSETTPELSSLSQGDVMVSEASTAAPYGFLRAVTSVSNQGNQVVVQTQAATLEDAIEQGVIHTSQVLSPENVRDSSLVKGVSLVNSASFLFELEDVVLFDKDGDEKTTGDQILAKGSITLSPEFDFDADIQKGQLKSLDFTYRANQITELEIEARVTGIDIKREKEIARHNFAPITVYVVTPVIAFPVVLTPILSVHVGIDGGVHVGVTAGVTHEMNMAAGLRYADKAWTPIKNFTDNFEYNPPRLTAGVDLKGYAGLQLELLLYGVVGPHIDINLYLKLEADIFDTPWWTLYIGLEAPVGINIEIFSRVITSHEVLVIAIQDILAQAKVSTEGTCGRFAYINQGIDRYPVFLPNGSKEPWFIDPFISDIFHENESAIVHGHQFMNNDWGPIGEYENARWLMGYLSVEYKTNCSELDTNDNIAFSSSSSSATNAGVMVMNSAGGDVRKIASLEVRNSYFLSVQCPTWSPEGDEIAFFKRTGLDFGDIFIVRNDGANSRNSTNNPYWYGKLVWSPDGTRFVYHTGYADSIQLIDVDSPLSHLAGISMSDGNPNWSPDSQLLVFDSTLSSTTAGIYMIKVDGSEPRQITDNPWMDTDPSWSPDGSKIAFVSNRDGDNEIFTMDVNGANVQQLTNNTSVDSDPVWSHNGAHIAFVSDRDGNNEIYVMNADGSNQHNVTNTPHQEYCPDWFGVR